MSKGVVTFSGGMDSTVLLYSAIQTFDEVLALSFVYGQKHRKELDFAKQLVTDKPTVTHKIIDLSFFKEISTSSALTNTDISVAKARDVMGDPQTVNYVPHRNMMLLSISCAAAETFGASDVWYGAAQADSVAGYWDGSTEFLNAINSVTILNRRNKVRVSAPLITKSKAEIIKWGREMGVPFDKTWTCYEGRDKACGVCTSCSLRIGGFIQARIKDPLEYEVTIPWVG